MTFSNDNITRPKAQILLSTYNGDRFLVALLNSILQQSEKNWILKVRDDGSSDQTLNILAEFAQADSRIQILFDSLGNLKPAQSYATLLNHAEKGIPVFFCDQDDLWHPQKIQSLLTALEASHPASPAAVFSDIEVTSESGQVLYSSFFSKMKYPTYGFSFEEFLVQNTIPGCSMALNATALELVRPVPSGIIMHDWWCLALIQALGTIRFVPEVLIRYRQHSEQASGGVDESSLIQKLKNQISSPDKNLKQLMIQRFRQIQLISNQLSLKHPTAAVSQHLKVFLEKLKTQSSSNFASTCLEYGLRMQGPVRTALLFVGLNLYRKEIVAELDSLPET